MKKILSVLIGVAMIFGTSTAVQAADIPDEQWTPAAYPQGDGWRSLYIQDGSVLNRTPSHIMAEVNIPGDSIGPIAALCENVDSPECVKAPTISASAFLQPCSAQILTNCIESVWAIDPTGKKVEGSNPQAYPKNMNWNFIGHDAINLPAGGSPSIWDVAGAINGGGTTSYMVQVFTESFLTKAADSKVTSEQFKMERISVAISPVKEVIGRFSQQVVEDSSKTENKHGQGVGHPSLDEWRNCAMIDDGTCQLKQTFPAEYKFGLKIKLATKLTGWLHGRIYNPNVQITSGANESQLIEVEAEPVQVPAVGEWFKWDDLIQPIKDWILAGKVLGGQGRGIDKNLATGSFQEMPEPAGEYGIEALRIWLPQIKDKASASPSQWAFHNLSEGELREASGCIKNATDLAGFVTTNAAAYSAGPPAFNKEMQSLDYRVISPHFTSKGQIAIGTYDLRIKSSVARCIYGFTNAPIQASITILSEDGTQQTATQVINEKNGWMSLSAKGFTYSSPIIQVKLSQASEPVKEVAAATSISLKKKTITCVKGKSKKKVSGTSPKCPTGYKKVA